jgi:hypothetical protein
MAYLYKFIASDALSWNGYFRSSSEELSLLLLCPCDGCIPEKLGKKNLVRVISLLFYNFPPFYYIPPTSELKYNISKG